MSAERLVRDSRAALAQLAGLGAISQGRESVSTWKGLAERARNLGLTELGTHMDALAALLERRGALAQEPDLTLADVVLSVHDRVEGLASALVLWSIERSFA
jgi:hypothetical protein